MDFFLLEEEEGNRIPYHINKNRVIDTRLLDEEAYQKIPTWSVVEMELPEEGFFPDLLCRPFVLVSKGFMKTAVMYEPDIPYRSVKLWDRKSGANGTYFIPILEEAECLSGRTGYNKVGNRITEPVLDYEKIRNKVVFKIKGYDRKCIVGRMDFVESLLRRKARGIRIEKVRMDCDM